MDRELNTHTGDYTNNTIDTLKNEVYIRLRTPKGSWLFDAKLGSLLHTLQREKDLSRIDLLAVQYAEEALQPMLDSSRALKIDVTSSRLNNDFLTLTIDVVDSRNVKQVYDYDVAVI